MIIGKDTIEMKCQSYAIIKSSHIAWPEKFISPLKLILKFPRLQLHIPYLETLKLSVASQPRY